MLVAPAPRVEANVPLVIGFSAAFLLALGALAEDLRARTRRRVLVKPVVDPPLLHSINDDRCIGCEACVDVCPTEVLDLVDHKARVVRFSDCVQCEQCANACPTTALVMYRAGSTPRTLTVPELDEHFQTGVPGQYLIGEVAGKPLVKNAANLGRAVIEHIARTLPPERDEAVLDVAIVGSGPGGLSAGLTCLRSKLRCVVLEKEHMLASTVGRYPKGKLFMAEPASDRNVSFLPVFDATKEELVAAWQRVVESVQLPVKLGEAVETVKRGDDGLFTIKTTVATYRARAVVLATGLRGKPRLLAVPGANLEKVKSRLDDPDVFAGKAVLVVGGGDSAVEAALSLAQGGATVTLSYRGDGFKRCKAGNQKRLADASAASQVRVLLESNVKEFTADAVTIQLADKTVETMPNDGAFVLIGADTPVVWLEANNVRFVEREHLYALGSTEAVVRRIVADVTECPKDPDAAIAALHGKPARTATRLRSMVEHIHDELRDAVTSVTGVFRIVDAEPSSRTNIARPPARRHETSQVASPPRPSPAPLVPAAHLTRARRPARPNPFDDHRTTMPARPRAEDTVVDVMPLAVRLAARQHRENPFGRGDHTTVVVERAYDREAETTVIVPQRRQRMPSRNVVKRVMEPTGFETTVSVIIGAPGDGGRP